METGTNEKTARRMIALVPTQADVDGLKVGDHALNCFGEFAEVVSIAYRGVDLKGKAYVGYYTRTSPTSSMSGSYKVNELVRTVHLGSKFTSAELDVLEKNMCVRGDRLCNAAGFNGTRTDEMGRSL